MSVGAIGAEILGGGGIHPPPWYTSLKHVMALGVNYLKSWGARRIVQSEYFI